MKNVMYALVVLMMFPSLASAQITITNSTFPVAGDILKYVNKGQLSTPLNIGNVGGPQTWDFSQLNSGSRSNDTIKVASAGPEFASFPDAELLLTSFGQNQYIDVKTGKMSLIGAGGNNGFFPIPLKISYSSAPTYRRAPITFIQTANSTGKFNLDLAGDIIPDSLATTLPITVDSLRIQFISEETSVVDAFGTVNMQNKSVPVLREKVQSITDIKLFVKVPFVNWIDASVLISQIGGNAGGFGDLLGRDTSIIYNFYSATHKEILVSIDYDLDSTYNSVTFADIGGIISSTKNARLDITDMSAFPNPSQNIVNLSATNMTSGNYLLIITDMQGKVVSFKPTNIYDKEWQDQIDISQWPIGAYQVELINTSRTKAATTSIQKI
jgi:hypothetical protein